MVPKVLLVQPVLPVLRAPLVPRVQWARKVLPVRLVRPAPRARPV